MTTAPTLDGSGFVHLHNHAENSKLDGLSRIKTIAKTAAALGQKAMAITDHGSLAGAWKFQKNCLDEGIKPIIGSEVYLAIGSRFEKNFEVVANDDDNVSDADEGTEKTKRYMHLTVLARNEAGWGSLLALHNKAEDSFWYKPRVDFELLKEHGDGLIVLTGCLGGPVAGPLARAGAAERAGEAARRNAESYRITAQQFLDPETEEAKSTRAAGDDPIEQGERLTSMASEHEEEAASKAEDSEMFRNEARRNLNTLIDAVGRDYVFLEVMHHGIKAETHAYRETRALSAETGIPMVATNDCHYEHAEDAEAHDGFLAVGVGKSLDDPKRFSFNGTPDYYVKSEQEMLDVLGNNKNPEVAQAWRDACAMTVHVAELCADRVIPEPRMRLPRFPVPEGFDSERAYFHHLTQEGAIERFGTNPETGEKQPVPKPVLDRLQVEEDIICDMGFPAYFLIVWDIIAWSRSDYTPQDWVDFHAGKVMPENRVKKKPIMVGPGRGSAAGSMASYCMKIVGVDPLEYHLLFDRFLEPGREGMPDIDVDFEAARRSEVFNYVSVRWGRDFVAHIGTFNMALSKAAIKDAARILKPYGASAEVRATADAMTADGDKAGATKFLRQAEKDAAFRGAAIQKLGNQMSALVPAVGGKAYTFEKLANRGDQSTDAFRDLVESSGADAQAILKMAMSFEGITKAESIHACGFIISPEPLNEIFPLRKQSQAAGADPDAPRVICWDANDCEEIGMLKMDILGLTNLDIASQALEYISSVAGSDFELEEIPHPASEEAITRSAYSIIGAGKTAGVFQLDGAGMTATAQSVAPEDLNDLSAVVALYRPGPLKAGMDKTYARRKAKLEPVSYTAFTNDPEETRWIDSVMGETYGMAIYQETIMRLGTVVAGFDASQRSRLRKAMGKKKQSEMDACLTMWTEGAGVEHFDADGTLTSPVFAPDTAQKLWDFISFAAEYLFNASHSAAYGLLAYWTAYLKAGWPVEYSAAILAVADKAEKRLTALNALRADGIPVLSPDVNRSLERTAPDGKEILFGLSEIKNVGVNGLPIVNERLANGPYTSLANLVERVKITVSSLVGLIEAGAMDQFGPRLGLLMAARAVGKNVDTVVPAASWDVLEESTRQRQRLGVSLGIHPLVAKREILKAWLPPGAEDTGDFGGYSGRRMTGKPDPLHKISDFDGSSVTTLGVISGWVEKAYGGGRRANFSLESSKTSINGVIWDRTLSGLKRNGEVPKIGDIVCVSGKVKVRETIVEDEEGGEDETIRTKELNIFEMWPVDAAAAPSVPVESSEDVYSFSDLYKKVRSQELPTPPKGPGTPKPATAAPTQDAETLAPPTPRKDNLLHFAVAQDKRDNPKRIYVHVCTVGTKAVGKFEYKVKGESPALKSYAGWQLPKPDKLKGGMIYRFETMEKYDIVCFVTDKRKASDPANDELHAFAKQFEKNDSAWVKMPQGSSPNSKECDWYRLDYEVPSGEVVEEEMDLAVAVAA